MLPRCLPLTHSSSWHVGPRQGLSSETHLLGLKLENIQEAWCPENTYPHVPGISATLFPGPPFLGDTAQVKMDGHLVSSY